MDAHEQSARNAEAASRCRDDHIDGPLKVAADPCSGRRAGRPRSEACRLAILKAAYDVLTLEGLSRFTIERVAAAALVGRTTIYRWWPSRGALAVECLLDAVHREYRPGRSGDAVQDIRTHMAQVAAIMRGDAGRIIASILAEGQQDPTTLEAFETGYLKPRRLMLEKILSDGVQAGQMRRDLDIDTTIDMLIGGFLYHLMTQGGLTDQTLDSRIIDTAMGGCLPR